MNAEDLLSKYDESVRSLGQQLRDKLLATYPGITEQVDAAANIIGYGFGNGYKDTICTIIPSKKGIKLGFYKGIELSDPQGLLEGSGKVHKYMSVQPSRLESKALNDLLKVAALKYEARKRADSKM